MGFSLLETAENNGEFNLYATMTLLLLLLHSSNFWHIALPLTILAILAFIFSPLRYNTKFWFVVTAVIIVGNYQNWLQIDNHKYLLGYWCFALFCSLQTDNPDKSIAIASRWMIGLSFLFAVFWKTVSPDYLDGSFFYYSLLLDDRFNAPASIFGGLTNEMNQANEAARRALVNYDSHLTAVRLSSSPRIIGLAGFITWWTLLLEMLIAVAFLWPEGKFISRWRDLFLITFILSTYLVAPVIGFGWILVIMGIAQCSGSYQYRRLLYIISFVILQIYRLFWKTVF